MEQFLFLWRKQDSPDISWVKLADVSCASANSDSSSECEGGVWGCASALRLLCTAELIIPRNIPASFLGKTSGLGYKSSWQRYIWECVCVCSTQSDSTIRVCITWLFSSLRVIDPADGGARQGHLDAPDLPQLSNGALGEICPSCYLQCVCRSANCNILITT